MTRALKLAALLLGAAAYFAGVFAIPDAGYMVATRPVAEESAR